METRRENADRVKALARSLGFEPVGITTAEPAEVAEQHLAHWLRAGHAAGMRYMRRERPRRAHPRDLLPEAKSVICLAFNYFPGVPSLNGGGKQRDAAKSPLAPLTKGGRGDQSWRANNTEVASLGRIARYAVGEDYHRVLKKKLRPIERLLKELGGPQTKTKSLVDSSPLLEREFARRAGLGFIGRNTHLITLAYGSWVFLAEVLTSLPLDPDCPITVNCGTCTRCLEACPTGALVKPLVLDARKCISYWTIEHRGPIPEAMREKMQDWVFGCDLCQEVCPFNRRPTVTSEERFRLGKVMHTTVALVELLRLDSQAAFRERLRHSPLLRAGWEGVLRNAIVVAANQRARDALPWIRSLAHNASLASVYRLAQQVCGLMESACSLD